MIYLDHAATTPVSAAVLQSMLPYFREEFGNPSSTHSLGQRARAAVEGARRVIALSIGAYPDEIIFTSGGTESNNHAIKGIALQNRDRGNRIITSRIEHSSVLKTCRYLEGEGFEVVYLPVDREGLVDPDELRTAMDGNTILISIMHANNEIGTIQPVAEIGKLAREREIPFHTDAVQTFGHVPVGVDDFKVDLLSASAHKLFGPKGVGFLYVRRKTGLHQLLHGGEQEEGRRASTHNVASIVGFQKAVSIAGQALEVEAERLTRLRDMLIHGIQGRMANTELNGHPLRRLPNNVNMCFRGVEGASIRLRLDMAGIACSTASACSSATMEPSHVLLAIGLDEEAALSSVRFSLGRYTEEHEISRVLDILPDIVGRLRNVSPSYRFHAR
jgi:cysteine desulfurase